MHLHMLLGLTEVELIDFIAVYMVLSLGFVAKTVYWILMNSTLTASLLSLHFPLLQ